MYINGLEIWIMYVMNLYNVFYVNGSNLQKFVVIRRAEIRLYVLPAFNHDFDTILLIMFTFRACSRLFCLQPSANKINKPTTTLFVISRITER